MEYDSLYRLPTIPTSYLSIEDHYNISAKLCLVSANPLVKKQRLFSPSIVAIIIQVMPGYANNNEIRQYIIHLAKLSLLEYEVDKHGVDRIFFTKNNIKARKELRQDIIDKSDTLSELLMFIENLK